MNSLKMIKIMDHMVKDLHMEGDVFTNQIKALVVSLVNTTDLYEADGINLFKEFLLTGILDTPKYMRQSRKAMHK